MKKIRFLLSLLLLSLILVGCERCPYIVSFQNATMAGSDKNTIKVMFAKDDIYIDKAYDLMLQCDKENVTLNVHFENQPAFDINIKEKDYWYSLGNLYYSAKNLAEQEDFTNLKDAVNLTIIFESKIECNIKLKAVVGDKVENAEKTGYLLSNAQQVSKEYTQKITAIKE